MALSVPDAVSVCMHLVHSNLANTTAAVAVNILAGLRLTTVYWFVPDAEGEHNETIKIINCLMPLTICLSLIFLFGKIKLTF
jgi:hypothetical protein